MKTTFNKVRWLAVMLLVIFGAAVASAQVGGLDKTGDMPVCLNSDESYGVMPTSGSTYTWEIIAGTGGAGTLTNGIAPNNLISVNWTSIGTCNLVVTEKNAAGCSAVINSILITVNPLPEVDPMTAAVCSGEKIKINLPILSTNGQTIDKWDISAVVAAGLTGTATEGIGITNLAAIYNDEFVNTIGTPLTVVYTVIPYAGSCIGAPFTITVTITSGPEVSPMIAAACSGEEIEVTLPTLSTNGLTLDMWDISAVVAAGLTGTATAGTGILDPAAIYNDDFVNTTAAPLTVVYTVIPHAGSCVGSSFTVTVTINPLPSTSPIWHN